jgi:hypothetical protein
VHPSRNLAKGTQLLADCFAAFPNDTGEALNAYFVGLEAAKAGRRATASLVKFRDTWEEVWPDSPCPVTSGAITKPTQPAPPTQPPEPAEETVRNVGWNSLYPPGGIPRLPTAAFVQWAKKNGFAQPLTKEVRFTSSGKIDASGPFILLGFDGSPGTILYCRFGAWDEVKTVGWL